MKYKIVISKLKTDNEEHQPQINPIDNIISKSPRKKDEFEEEIDCYFKDKLTKPIELVPKKPIYSFDNRRFLIRSIRL